MKEMRCASKREIYVWNIAGSLCTSLRTVLLLVLVSRLCGTQDAGVFSVSFSTAQMFYTIAHFELCNVVVTSRREEFAQSDIFGFRLLSALAMVVLSAGFIAAGGFDKGVALAMAVCCLYMLVLAAAELCENQMHFFDHLELAGKSQVYHMVFETAAFALGLALTKSLPAALLIMCASGLVLLFVYNIPLLLHFCRMSVTFSALALKKLLWLSAPLCCLTFTLGYILNAPKYAIQASGLTEAQSYYGYLFMPATCINLFSIFAVRPQLQPLARAIQKENYAAFAKASGYLLIWVLASGMAASLGAYWLGIPVLELIYGVPMQALEVDLLLMMLGGIGYAVCSMLGILATVLRAQKRLVWGYLAVAVLAVPAASLGVGTYGFRGAVLAFVMLMLCLSVLNLAIVWHSIRKAAHTSVKRE